MFGYNMDLHINLTLPHTAVRVLIFVVTPPTHVFLFTCLQQNSPFPPL